MPSRTRRFRQSSTANVEFLFFPLSHSWGAMLGAVALKSCRSPSGPPSDARPGVPGIRVGRFASTASRNALSSQFPLSTFLELGRAVPSVGPTSGLSTILDLGFAKRCADSLGVYFAL
jgi:hypothetical protein